MSRVTLMGLLGVVLATPMRLAQTAALDHPVVITAKLDAEGLSLLLVPIRVGAATFWCNVDSGGSWVFSIDKAKALEAGLQPNATGSIAGVGPDVVQDQRVRGATVEIGSVVLRDTTLVLVPLPAVVPDMDCVFGLGLLHDYIVEFDYVTPTLRIFSPDTFQPSATAISLAFDLDRFRNPHLPARLRVGAGDAGDNIESVEGDFMLDTGAGYYSAALTKPFVDANHLAERVGPVASRVSDTPGLVIAAARPPSLTVGQVEIAGPVTALLRTPSRGIVEDGLVGTGFLRRFAVTFDYTRKRLWLEPNDRLHEQQPFDASGLEFRLSGDRAYAVAAVVAVAPGSAGDAAGVQKGDVLLQIDERAARDLTLGDIQALLSRSGVRCSVKFDRRGTARTVMLELRARL